MSAASPTSGRSAVSIKSTNHIILTKSYAYLELFGNNEPAGQTSKTIHRSPNASSKRKEPALHVQLGTHRTHTAVVANSGPRSIIGSVHHKIPNLLAQQNEYFLKSVG